ncbi:hypothetical protein D9V41_15155 [Aeromicrobium phragmitis]|uniref:Uncharacterized protein n=1 Tax=Aeromicrobium phragmitis TaxID=2478914 RepID=A0A3L8PHA6_9ACTN|nr:hypothetical protein [Aeromicrobium phragmitis]RLV54656.1 hypothetical protein D9V41_15155 [Aeromicrobium phragmitis]
MSAGTSSSFHRTVSLFAIACLSALVVGPFAAWMAHERGSMPGSFAAERYRAGEEFRVSEPGRSVAVWALPADTDRSAVRCTSNDEPRELAETRTTQIDGESAVLLLDDEFLSLEKLVCTGGGLSTIAVSSRLAESTSRTMTIGALVAAPVLVVVGLALRRRGFRWPV